MDRRAAHAALDDWLDRRFEDAQPAGPLLRELTAAGLDLEAIEALLRAGRASYPELPCARGVISEPLPLRCDHVDHETAYLLYVPRAYDPAIAWPLLVVGHGGSVARDLAFAEWAARSGMEPFWTDAAEAFGFVLLAPLTDRGWGAIGNSILFSAISHASRAIHVDPDRVYLTGHSMGGHLAFRSAMNFADRFAAVSPMSGGYDYVADRSVENLVNVPGFATWGTREPYGLREANRVNADWMRAHHAPWRFAECDGGHEIFPETIPAIAEFLLAHPRQLVRERTAFRAGGRLVFDTADAHPAWGRTHTWRPGRGITTNSCHALALDPLPADTPPSRAVQEVTLALTGENRVELTCRNARIVHVALHADAIDLTRPVTVIANGAVVFRAPIEPDAAQMLERVRAFDDRGRIFHASVTVEVPETERDGRVLA